MLSLLRPFSNSEKEGKKKRSRHGLRFSNRTNNITLDSGLKSVKDRSRVIASDGYNSETTAESSNHSLSDSERSSDSNCKNQANEKLSNYFYRGSRSLNDHARVGKKLKKKIRREKLQAQTALKAPLPEMKKSIDSGSAAYADQLAFIEAMKSMNLGIPSKSCELGGNFVHNSIRVNGRTESIYVMDMGALLDDAFPNNPPVISHVQC